MRVMTPFPSTLLPNAELRRPSRSFGVLRKMHLIARSLNMWKWQENIRMPHEMIFPQYLCSMPLYLDFLGFYTNAKKANGGHFAAGTIQEYCRKLINEVTHFYTLIIRFYFIRFYSEHNF